MSHEDEAPSSGPLPAEAHAAVDDDGRDPPAEAQQVPEIDDDGSDIDEDALPEDVAAAVVERTLAERQAVARELMADAALRRFLVSVMQRAGVLRDTDLEDLLQVVYLQAVRLRLPDDPRERRNMLAKVARRRCVDFRRKKAREPEIAQGVAPEDVGAAAPSPVEARDALYDIERSLVGDQVMLWKCLVRVGSGESVADLAKETGVEYSVLYKRLAVLRTTLRALAGLGVLGLLGLIVFILFRRPAMAPDFALDVETPEPELRSHVVVADPSAHATALRAAAYRDCLASAWQRCREGLDVAAHLDPAGDSDPRVAAAREDAREGIRHSGDKPGSGWVPKNRAVYEGAARR